MKLVEELRQELKESSLSRVRQAWSEHATGTITAFRGAADCGTGARYSNKQNYAKNRILKSKLLSLGYGVTAVKGAWIENGDKEVSEASYYVVDLKDKGNLKKDLIKLGEEFEQDAITFAEREGDYYAISSNRCENSWPGFGSVGKMQKLGMPKFGKTGIEGFSRVNNRAFVFESFELVTKTDFPPTEIRSINHINEVDWREVVKEITD